MNKALTFLFTAIGENERWRNNGIQKWNSCSKYRNFNVKVKDVVCLFVLLDFNNENSFS